MYRAEALGAAGLGEGLAWRRRCKRCFPRRGRRCARRRGSCQFKQVNERFGHLRGDDCLRCVANPISDASRARTMLSLGRRRVRDRPSRYRRERGRRSPPAGVFRGQRSVHDHRHGERAPYLRDRSAQAGRHGRGPVGRGRPRGARGQAAAPRRSGRRRAGGRPGPEMSGAEGAGPEGASAHVSGEALQAELGRARTALSAQSAVARVLAEAEALPEATPRLLEAIGRSLGWEVGAIWTVDARAGVLRCEATWHAGASGEEFETATTASTFALGEGLPGRVWSRGTPEWVSDFSEEGLPRSPIAAREGLAG